MKVMIAVHGLPPRQVGGGEWVAYNTALGLQKRGHDVRVLAVDEVEHPGCGLDIKRGCENSLDVTRISFNLERVSTSEYDNGLIGDYLRDRMLEERPDIFHLISGFRMTGRAVCVARELGIPVIVTLTEFYWVCPRASLIRSTGEPCDRTGRPLECLYCFLVERQRRYRLPEQATGGLSGNLLVLAWEHTRLLERMGLEGKAKYFREWLEFLKSTLGQADKVIAPSRFILNAHVRAGIPRELLVFCRQGLNMAKWNPAPPAANGSGPVRIGFIGNVLPHKGVDVLVRAFRRLGTDTRNARLDIFGNFDKNTDYGRLLLDLKGEDARISFRGPYNNLDIPGVMSGIDLLVVPSVCHENSPNVMLEAFANDTPVVASNTGGMAELVDRDVNGDVFPMGSDAGLAKVLKRVVERPEILDHWRRGIPRVKSLEEEIEELETIYLSVISDRNAAAAQGGLRELTPAGLRRQGSSAQTAGVV